MSGFIVPERPCKTKAQSGIPLKAAPRPGRAARARLPGRDLLDVFSQFRKARQRFLRE
jgi:hypothetical protein